MPARTCHPDVVAGEYKQEATKLFAQLSTANEKNDVATVKKIYEHLQKGIFTPMSAVVSDVQKLHRQVVRMREKVKDIAVAIHELRKTDAWRKVEGIKDWDAYFAQIKEQLQAELDSLEVQ